MVRLDFDFDLRHCDTLGVRSSLLAATTLLSALVWTVALIVDSGPFSGASVLLIGLGMLLTSTVATVGMIVVGGRWAHRLGLTALGLTIPLALVRDLDPLWALAMTATAIAVVSLLSPTLTATIRKLPSASGPPPRAVTPALLLLIAPALLGFAGTDSTAWALLAVGLTAPTAAFVYSRVLPGGLLTVRLVWPILTLALSPLLGWAGGLTAAAMAVAVAAGAWGASVKASYHPPREVGTTFPIPPELAPREVLEVAEIDEKGRRR